MIPPIKIATPDRVLACVFSGCMTVTILKFLGCSDWVINGVVFITLLKAVVLTVTWKLEEISNE